MTRRELLVTAAAVGLASKANAQSAVDRNTSAQECLRQADRPLRARYHSGKRAARGEDDESGDRTGQFADLRGRPSRFFLIGDNQFAAAGRSPILIYMG